MRILGVAAERPEARPQQEGYQGTNERPRSYAVRELLERGTSG